MPKANDTGSLSEFMPLDPEGGLVFNQNEALISYYPRAKKQGNDYDNNESIVIRVNYRNVRDLLARFFLTAYYDFRYRVNWRINCVGITSSILTNDDEYVPSSFHLPMLDYDGKNVRKKIRSDVKLLQKEYSLGDAWVFGTKRGYHVYFLCDAVSKNQYFEMLNKTQCCKGFRTQTQKRGFATLRVSAKYTKFDIKLLYILRSRVRHPKRINQLGHLALALIDLGAQCGTHFASLFPEQAPFKEDSTEWVGSEKPNRKKKKYGIANKYITSKKQLYKVYAEDKLIKPQSVILHDKATNTEYVLVGNPCTESEPFKKKIDKYQDFYTKQLQWIDAGYKPKAKTKESPKTDELNYTYPVPGTQKGCKCADCTRIREKYFEHRKGFENRVYAKTLKAKPWP